MKNISVIILISIWLCQPVKVVAAQDTTSIHKQCVLIAAAGDSILKGSTDSVRIIYHALFQQGLDTIVRMPASFDYSFAIVKNLSALTADDERFRIYTWMLPTNKGMKYSYSGFVQVYNKEKKTVKVYSLKEKEYTVNETSESLRLTDSTWYGALYYKIVHKRYDKKDQYILLGWKGKDIYSTRKVIDNIVITPSKIEFGKPVIKGAGKPKGRIILEYNASASVSLRYNEVERMIIWDHLSSSDPKPEARGVYALYGPDLTYDGLKFKDGFWFLQQDIQVRNEYAPPPKDVELKHDLRMQRKE